MALTAGCKSREKCRFYAVICILSNRRELKILLLNDRLQTFEHLGHRRRARLARCESPPSSAPRSTAATAAFQNKRSRMEFQIKIRRKPLFYTIVLIVPVVLMAFLNMSVFFLPADSTEKERAQRSNYWPGENHTKQNKMA